MFSFNVCRFALFSFLTLSANADADTVRDVHRELTTPVYEDDVELGTAGTYVILAKAGITNVPTSIITGNIAVSPIAAGAMTGFDLVLNSDGTEASSTQLATGKATAASYLGDTPTLLTTAVSNMETAYDDAAGRTKAVGAKLNFLAGVLNIPVTFTPGVHTFGTDVLITDTINFRGTATDVFIIQITGNLKQAENKNVILSGGALAKNIFYGRCRGGRRFAHEGHPFGKDRRYFHYWFFP
jgi:hypothetical protein